MSEEMTGLLDELEDVLTKSTRLPFVRRLMVDEEQATALLDRLRAAVPEEVRRARQILRERDQLLEQARRQAQRIAEQAQQEVSMRLERDGLLDEAKMRTGHMVEVARRDAAVVRRGADDYARKVLTEIEDLLSQTEIEFRETLGRTLLSVRKGLRELESDEEILVEMEGLEEEMEEREE
jgi:cell division septum initiation protein DivIVA